jgi:hypothetical protein
MPLFFLRMRKELGLNTFGVHPRRHEIVAAVAQNTDQLGGQRFIEKLVSQVPIEGIRGGDSAFLNVITSASSQGLDVGKGVTVGGTHEDLPLAAELN